MLTAAPAFAIPLTKAWLGAASALNANVEALRNLRRLKKTCSGVAAASGISHDRLDLIRMPAPRACSKLAGNMPFGRRGDKLRAVTLA